MKAWTDRAAVGLVLVTSLLGTGCREKRGGAEEKPLKVNVSTPVAQNVTDYEVFSGRTEALESTDVRARVSGYLDKILFKDGDHVQAGDVLFEIDPRPYEAALAKARAGVAQARASVRQYEASVTQNRASLTYLASENQRNRRMVRSGAVSGSEMDKTQGDLDATSAALTAARSSVEVAKANVAAAEAEEQTTALNVDFTKVRAPISGVVSRRFVDRGALVTADTTVLTNIVRLDKVYAYFDVDERTWLDLRDRLTSDGQPTSMNKAALPVTVGLANDTGYPFEGLLDFADNRLDPSTGTMRMRGTFDNADRRFQPGMFVRVRLPVGKPHQATLISEQALGNDQGRPFVYVLDAEDKVVYRRVEPGALHEGLREILPPREGADSADPTKTEGLRPGDRVVLNGMQRLRPGMKVAPNNVSMPNPRQAVAQGAGARGPRSEAGKQKARIPSS